MKTKNKMIALVEIAIVLCSLFLVALPVIAAEQNQQMQKASANEVTTASEDDYVLGIYGNANEDDTIDMGDVVYTKLAIFGKKPKTTLCDAKYDGRINVLDVIQTKLIILGKEKELTVIDSYDRIVTVKKPLQRIVLQYRDIVEMARSLKVPKDKVVAVASFSAGWKAYFPEYSDTPHVGNCWNPDVEAILTLNPDIVFIIPGIGGRWDSALDSAQDILEPAGIPVIRFYGSLGYEPETYPEEIMKLGYIFNKVAEAEEFRDWHENVLNTIREKVKGIPEEDKPKVYFESWSGPYSASAKPWGHVDWAGGKNIFETGGTIDPEAVIERDPDIIVKTAMTRGEPTCGYHLDKEDTAGQEEIKDEIMNRPELQNVKAVKAGKVYIICQYILHGGPDTGPRCFLQHTYFAKWFHPDLFEDLDPQALHQEYLTRFQGLDFDLDKHGVFVYPEPS